MMEVEGHDEHESLFNDDEDRREMEEEANNPDDYAVEVPATQGGTQGNVTANLDLTGAGEKPKRIIKNPQPKLNPDRIMGPRGLQALEEEFKDWKSKGHGHEFEDLDQILYKLNHWTHRLFPKLPFDATLNIIENRLGNKKVVQTHVKKIRLGMAQPPARQTQDQDGEQQIIDNDDEDNVDRYDGDREEANVTSEDQFDNLASTAASNSTQERPANRSSLSEEQLERMRRNKELAAQKKRERELAKQRQQNNSSQEDDIREAERELEIERENLEARLDDEEELMREMERDEQEMEEASRNLSTNCNIQSQHQQEQSRDQPAEQSRDQSADFGAQIEPEPEKNPQKSSPTADDGNTELLSLDEVMDDMES